MKNAENPILTISLLTSDRMKTIPRCLDSLIPLREAIPCELIIVDTSKSMEVREYILTHTDLVETFEWCNDFAKARNVGLEKAKGEWFMFIDDDEWFMDINPLIEFFKSGEYKDYGYAHFKIRNYHDTYLETYGDGWVSRLARLQKDSRFHSKVHEYLSPVKGKDKVLEVLLGHSGYVYTTKEARQKHFDRNSSLLRKMEEEEPDNLRWKVQQIQEYRSIAAWEELKEYCEKTIKFLEVEGRKVILEDLLQIYVGYMIALVNTQSYEEAVKIYSRYKHMFKRNLFAKAFMNACVAEAYFYLKEYESMKKYAGEYLDAYETYKADPKSYEKESLRLILSATFNNERFCGTNSMFLAYEIDKGNYESVYKYYPYLKWNEKGVKVYCGLDRKILNAILELKDYEMLKTVLQDALSTITIRSKMMSEILLLSKSKPKEYQNILDLIKELDIDAWYKPYAALLRIDENAEKEVVYTHALEFIKATPDIFEVPNEIRNVVENHNIEVESLYREFDFITWKNILIDNLEKMQWDKVEEVKERLEKSSIRQDYRFGYFMIIYCEQKLLNGIDKELTLDEYSELLYTYSQFTTQTYEVLFAEQLQQMEIEQLPKNYQAAMWLKLYFEELANNYQDALACLGKVAEAYPMFVKIIKYYLSLFVQ